MPSTIPEQCGDPSIPISAEPYCKLDDVVCQRLFIVERLQDTALCRSGLVGAQYKPCVRILRVIRAARVPRTYGDVKGLEVSLGRFFQDLLIQGEIGNRSLQPCVFPLQRLEPFCLIEVDSTVIPSPPIISVVGDTDLSYCLPNTLATRNGNFDLSELIEYLFRAMTFSLAFLPPFNLSII